MRVLPEEDNEGGSNSAGKAILVGDEEAQQIMEEVENELRGLREMLWQQAYSGGGISEDEKDEVSILEGIV